MKRSLKNRITNLGLSYQKEMIILTVIEVVIVAASIVLYFVNKKILIPIFGGVIALVVAYLYLSKYTSMEIKRKKEHVSELISLLSYFELFISNKNNKNRYAQILGTSLTLFLSAQARWFLPP